MIIEINKDIDQYQESLVMGLTAKQFFFSMISLITGGSIVLLLYRYLGLTLSIYIAIPIISPLALEGFYSFHGMDFYEVVKRKCFFLFFHCPLVYVSTEGEEAIQAFQKEKIAKEKAKKRKEKKRKKQRIFVAKKKNRKGTKGWKN